MKRDCLNYSFFSSIAMQFFKAFSFIVKLTKLQFLTIWWGASKVNSCVAVLSSKYDGSNPLGFRGMRYFMVFQNFKINL